MLVLVVPFLTLLAAYLLALKVTFTLFRHSIELQPEASPAVVSLWVNTNKLSLYSFVKETNNSRTLVIIRMKDL